MKQFPDEEMQRMINDLHVTPFVVHRFDKALAMESVAMARSYNFTIYDASYVALAKQLGVVVLTADRKLTKKINDPTLATLLEEI